MTKRTEKAIRFTRAEVVVIEDALNRADALLTLLREGEEVGPLFQRIATREVAAALKITLTKPIY